MLTLSKPIANAMLAQMVHWDLSKRAPNYSYCGQGEQLARFLVLILIVPSPAQTSQLQSIGKPVRLFLLVFTSSNYIIFGQGTLHNFRQNQFARHDVSQLLCPSVENRVLSILVVDHIKQQSDFITTCVVWRGGGRDNVGVDEQCGRQCPPS